MKTRGWFLLSFILSSQAGAINLDFDAEIRKREIVSVRLSDDLSGTQKAAQQNPDSRALLSESNDENSSSTFSVRLKPIKR